ncbi:hypothetical protein GMST_37870 [Geomonas silvestris]|uniref:Uncharacterized protein n=1 Tax=Geomonas silvestris TaxID=2740184 RepID=A0A6V8MNA7_9BACT|nr:hypothetical protein [Geomonas silvestris]GFO61462.1 hypothetical protein GMST_37870 [Geomonas silvestris]
MRIKLLVPTLLITALSLSFGPGSAHAANVAVQINGYLPAPPGVSVQVDAGRPYYVQDERRVYIEKEPRHYKKKHHKKHDNGNHYGQDRHEGRDKHEGHGR